MRLLNFALVLVTALAVAGGYLQEKKRLATVRALPPAKARALLEAAHRRRERGLMALTAVLIAAAVLALAVGRGA